jgi:hypothetical protein
MKRLLPWVLAAGAAAAFVLLWPGSPPGGSISQHQPGPGDPPVVWAAGRLTDVAAGEVVLQEGDGPFVHMQRLAAGATAVYRRAGGEWVQDQAALRRGRPACVEALLDGESFVAVRVFVGAEGCGPA